MNHKKLITTLLAISLLGAGIGFALMYPEYIGICEFNDRECIFPTAENIGQPTATLFASLTLILLFLLFASQEVFRTWRKVAPIVAILAVIWIIATPIRCGGSLGLCFDKELVTWISAVAFLAISLLIIIAKSILLTRQRKSP